MFKICRKCSVEKSLDDFYKGNASQGKMTWCKECSHKYQVERHKQFPERQKQRDSKRLTSPKGRADNLYRAAKRRALEKNLEFSLTLARIEVALFIGVCERTNIAFDLSQPAEVSRNIYAPSIDRKDAFKGYTDDNVQVVVSAYNAGKGQYTDDEFIAFCKIVAERCT